MRNRDNISNPIAIKIVFSPKKGQGRKKRRLVRAVYFLFFFFFLVACLQIFIDGNEFLGDRSVLFCMYL